MQVACRVLTEWDVGNACAKTKGFNFKD